MQQKEDAITDRAFLNAITYSAVEVLSFANLFSIVEVDINKSVAVLQMNEEKM